MLYEHHGVKTVDDLERICREHKLRELPRMGAKLEEKVLRSIEAYKKSAGRFLLSFGTQYRRGDCACSFPRFPALNEWKRRAVYGAGAKPLAISTFWSRARARPKRCLTSSNIRRRRRRLGLGENKASVVYGLERLQVDVRALAAESFGAALQYFTGSKEHNVAVRTNAVRQGFDFE